MRIRPLVVTLVIGCASNLSINTAINQSAIAQTADQIRRLRAVGIPVVMPTYVSRGFRLANFKVDIEEGGHSDYTATYNGPNKCSFSVNGANGGWGAPGPVRQWTVNTSLFGKVILEEWDGSSAGGPNQLNSSVLPDSGRGVLKGYPKAGYMFNFGCERSVFSSQTASQIIKSTQIRK